jgi:hypothetical protein
MGPKRDSTKLSPTRGTSSGTAALPILYHHHLHLESRSALPWALSTLWLIFSRCLICWTSLQNSKAPREDLHVAIEKQRTVYLVFDISRILESQAFHYSAALDEMVQTGLVGKSQQQGARDEVFSRNPCKSSCNRLLWHIHVTGSQY